MAPTSIFVRPRALGRRAFIEIWTSERWAFLMREPRLKVRFDNRFGGRQALDHGILHAY
jgi:hypothetical protein